VAALLVLGWLARRDGARPAFLWVARGARNVLALVFSSLSLPLGPEERVLRRVPWVTLAIVGLCAAVFQAQRILEPGPGWPREYARARKDAVAYAGERPHLKLPPALAALAGREIARRWRQAAAPEWPPDWPKRGREQAELDRRAEALLTVFRKRPTYRWADVPAHGTWLTGLRSGFVHGGWWHLVGNMIFLLAFAPYVEDAFGRSLFLLLYLGSDVVGNVAVGAARPGGFFFTYGASGAISGVMGAFLVRFARRPLALLNVPALWFPVPSVKVCVPAFAFLLFAVARDVRGAWLGIPGTGWWAHLGGFAFGVAFAAFVRATGIEKCLIEPGIEESLTLRSHPAVARSCRLRFAGRPAEALRVAEAALRARPGDAPLLREAWDAAVAAGALDRAGTHATRLVEQLGARRDGDHAREALLFVGEVRAALGAAVPRRFHFAAGDCLQRQGQEAQALLLYGELAGHHAPVVAREASARRARLLARGATGRPSGARPLAAGQPSDRGGGPVFEPRRFRCCP
jgi:membrane associated rhomboid family serine protease